MKVFGFFINILTVGYFSAGYSADIQDFEVGDRILFHNEATGVRKLATVTEVALKGDTVRLDFGNWLTNTQHRGYYAVDKYVKDYTQVDEYTYKTYYWIGRSFKLRIGDTAFYVDSAAILKGTIVDLTADGFAKLNFGNPSINSFYGDYHRIRDHIQLEISD
jgi:signal peptidase I